MTKQEIVQQEYRNLLEKIYQENYNDMPSIITDTIRLAEKYLEALDDKYKTLRCRFFCNEKEYKEEYDWDGNRPQYDLSPYEQEVYKYFKTDYYEDENADGIKELTALLKEYSNEVYKKHPNNIYAKMLAFAFKNDVEDFIVKDQYEALISQLNSQNNISEFIKSIEQEDNLHTKNFDYNSLKVNELEAILFIYEQKINYQENFIKSNTPKPEFSREHYNGESYWENNGRKQSEDEIKNVFNARKIIEKYNKKINEVKQILQSKENTNKEEVEVEKQ